MLHSPLFYWQAKGKIKIKSRNVQNEYRTQELARRRTGQSADQCEASVKGDRRSFSFSRAAPTFGPFNQRPPACVFRVRCFHWIEFQCCSDVVHSLLRNAVRWLNPRQIRTNLNTPKKKNGSQWNISQSDDEWPGGPIQLAVHHRLRIRRGWNSVQHFGLPGRVSGTSAAKRHQLVPRLLGVRRPARLNCRHAVRSHGRFPR